MTVLDLKDLRTVHSVVQSELLVVNFERTCRYEINGASRCDHDDLS